MQQPNPILVEVSRGTAVESQHRGAVAVVDAAGRLALSLGDIDRPVYPRSAVKPLQALPLLATGAARAFGVTAEEIALACASHGGEPVHTTTVAAWLQRLGLDADALECGAHPPSDRHTRNALARRRESPSALHNNCSGKHTGFLTVCRHLEFPTRGYVDPGHPVQHLVRDALSRLTGTDLDHASPGVDGCGIPVYGIPLRALAGGMAGLVHPSGQDDDAAPALAAIVESMVAHPYLVAGRDRFCTALMETLAPNVVAKTGAEGVYCAAIRDRGLGVAVKIDDGAARAAEVALGGVLRVLGAVGNSHFAALRSKLEPDVVNVTGRTVGSIRPSAALAGAEA